MVAVPAKKNVHIRALPETEGIGLNISAHFVEVSINGPRLQALGSGAVA